MKVNVAVDSTNVSPKSEKEFNLTPSNKNKTPYWK